MSLRFHKLHGTGNDYVFLDLVTNRVDEFAIGPFAGSREPWVSLARAVSDRHFGAGSDGLILILPGEAAGDFKMRIFNADGSEGEMCGNGIRCLGKYVYDHGLTRSRRLLVETLAGVKELELSVDPATNRVTSVRVDMGAPAFERARIPMKGDPNSKALDQELALSDGQSLRASALSMGNPHCVTVVQSLEDYPVGIVGPQVERHELFPNRTNVEFVEIVGPRSLRMRVWERGSGETMACGTGACASVVACSSLGLIEREADVRLSGGTLHIEWAEDDHVYMTGPAVEVYSGEFARDWLEELSSRA